jgi:hypothetical protein
MPGRPDAWKIYPNRVIDRTRPHGLMHSTGPVLNLNTLENVI